MEPVSEYIIVWRAGNISISIKMLKEKNKKGEKRLGPKLLDRQGLKKESNSLTQGRPEKA
jgi:hypothetical protein